MEKLILRAAGILLYEPEADVYGRLLECRDCIEFSLEDIYLAVRAAGVLITPYVYKEAFHAAQ